MAEFTFSCPQCGKGIQCDARYAGSQINCPNCQQVVAVPSTALPDAAPGREVIQIKKSAMRNILAVAAAIIVLAGLGSFGWHLWFGNSRLAGDWKMGGPYNVGKPCQILQSGNELTFVNENGAQSSGVFKSKSVVIALDWEGGIRGTLNTASGYWMDVERSRSRGFRSRAVAVAGKAVGSDHWRDCRRGIRARLVGRPVGSTQGPGRHWEGRIHKQGKQQCAGSGCGFWPGLLRWHQPVRAFPCQCHSQISGLNMRIGCKAVGV